MTAMPQLTDMTSQLPSDSADAGGNQNGREARNLAEKHRRDKLNGSIQELATMVPHVADATRRMDKTAVLRFAAHGLRLQYVFGKSTRKNLNMKLGQPRLTSKLMQLLNSFFITLTCHGQIVLVSENVEQLLGHCQSDLYGQNILQITHPDDVAILRQQLIPKDMESLFRTNYSDDGHIKNEEDDDDIPYYSDDEDNEESKIYNDPSTNNHIDERLRSDRRCFIVRLARAGARSETNRSYEIVKIDGCFRRSDCSTSAGSYPIVSQFIRRSRCSSGSSFGSNPSQHEAITQAALHGISGNDIVLVAMARVLRPQRVINRLINANQLEYQTRHLIDGRIIDCDQRIGIVAGYMKDEVRNLSPFSFMHQDDVRWVIVALRQMYDCNSDYGESCYRLLSRNGHFIYLQTRGYLEIDKGTNKVHSFVCINTLLDEEEGRRKVQEMKDKFSIIIKTKIPSNSLQDVPASQNPQQLERIVLYLIKNLQKRNDEPPLSEDLNDSNHSDGSCTRSTKTLSIALVPPEPASVRNSISKSVDVVNITAAKNLQYSQKNECSQSPKPNKDYNRPMKAVPVAATVASSQPRPSVLKISASHSPSSVSSKESVSTEMSELSEHSCCSSSSLSPQSMPSTITAVTPTKVLQQKISVLKRLHISSHSESDDCISPAKRCGSAILDADEDIKSPAQTTEPTELHSVLSTSLQHLEQSLLTIDNKTRILREQRVQFGKSNQKSHPLDDQLGAIYVEHRKQREILVNIQTQYDAHLQHPNH